MIKFNKPYITGKEASYISNTMASGKISGNGRYTKFCQDFFEDKYKIKKALLTTSCTAALEMAAILINIKEGDEVIIPSYTFLSTANAFVLRGAKIVFADSCSDNPNIDAAKIEGLITSKTKAIVPVHYAGFACDMDVIMDIAKRHNLFVIEDAAQAIGSYYKGKALGSIGHLATFSFHETKNVTSGEGGLLAINDVHFFERAEIIWENGSNKAAYYRGEVDVYTWKDVGSSFLMSEINAAFLWAQLECLEKIQKRRRFIWAKYNEQLRSINKDVFLVVPSIQKGVENNAHMYYLVCTNKKQRNGLINFLKKNGVMAAFHYQSLHQSNFYQSKHDGRELPNTKKYSDCLVRLPFYYELKDDEIDCIIELIKSYFNK